MKQLVYTNCFLFFFSRKNYYFCQMQRETALLELQCFPSIPYLSKFFSFNIILIEQQENYIKRSYRNRFQIASANGPLSLSIPLEKGKNQQQSITDVSICYHTSWQRKYWTAIQSAYGKSPYFEYYSDDIKQLLFEKQKRLFDFNKSILDYFIHLFQIETTVRFTESYVKVPSIEIVDLRNTISPKIQESTLDKYYQLVEYQQVFMEKTGFLPNLSILDLLFCQGPEAVITLAKSAIPKI